MAAGFVQLRRSPIAKLVAYRTELASFEGNANPFAIMIVAHLAAQEIRQMPAGRRK
jgi:hypothetical protein